MPFGRPRTALPAALLLVAASLLLAACGGEGTNPELLPEKQANSMLDDLEAAEAAFEEGKCDTVDRRLQKVLDRINGLGAPPISKELKLNLREGVNEVMEQSAECEPADTADPEAPDPDTEPTPAPTPDTPEEQPDSEDEEEPTPPEDTTPDEPDVPAPDPEPEPQPEPEPTPEPTPTPTPPATPPGGSGGVGPAAPAPGAN